MEILTEFDFNWETFPSLTLQWQLGVFTLFLKNTPKPWTSFSITLNLHSPPLLHFHFYDLYLTSAFGWERLTQQYECATRRVLRYRRVLRQRCAYRTFRLTTFLNEKRRSSFTQNRRNLISCVALVSSCGLTSTMTEVYLFLAETLSEWSGSSTKNHRNFMVFFFFLCRANRAIFFHFLCITGHGNVDRVLVFSEFGETKDIRNGFVPKVQS